jgi:hypothetical protein
VQREIAETYPKEELAVYVVWVPMIPTDNEAAARKSSLMYADKRFRQFYDPDRLSGIAFSKELSLERYQALLDSLPPDHPMKEGMVEYLRLPPEERPAWDVAYFFSAGTRWGEGIPTSLTWSKQVGFHGDQEGDRSSGRFFRNDSKEPVESDWFVEIREGMKRLIQAPAKSRKGK